MMPNTLSLNGARAPGNAQHLAVAVIGLIALYSTAAVSGIPLWRAFVLLVVAPFAEEVVFRMGLHESVLQWAGWQRWANVMVAVAFAAMHWIGHGSAVVWLTALPALLIGAVYEQYRRVLPCALLHAFLNAVWLWASIRY